MKEYEVLQLLEPQNSTSAGLTGSYIDTQGYIGHGHRNVMFVLGVGDGTTAGTAGGSIQTAEDTAGTGVATLVSFSTATSVGGSEAVFGVIPAAHRYVRFLGSVQSGKDMYLYCAMIAANRYSP